jgi:hypothetical protein
MDGKKLSLESLKNQLRQFAADRDWNQFHSPKNLKAADHRVLHLHSHILPEPARFRVISWNAAICKREPLPGIQRCWINSNVVPVCPVNSIRQWSTVSGLLHLFNVSGTS